MLLFCLICINVLLVTDSKQYEDSGDYDECPNFGNFKDPECSSPENIALNKEATQSSTYTSHGGGAAWKAVDGNDDSFWYNSYTCSHTLADVTPWWQVDLGCVNYVARVLITNRGDCCSDRLKNFKVEVGKSEETMTLCAEQAESPGPGEEVMLVCPEAMTGRFIKISMNNKNYLQLCEVKVYSC